MIVVRQIPLPDPDRKRLQEWLRQPECLLLRQVLAGLAAQAAADAAVDLCAATKGAEDTARADAEEHAETARRYAFAKDLLDQMVLKQYEWRRYELQPLTATNPEPQ